MMRMKALLMHVAADTSNIGTVGICGPIFEDKNFESIPIKEAKSTNETRTYSSLPSRNKKFASYLADFVPYDIQNDIVHCDPDFDHFTYSDPVNSMRGRMLRKLQRGDFIFFVASLVLYRKDSYANSMRNVISANQKGKMRKCIIGYFKISKILSLEKSNNDLKDFESKNSIPKYYSQIMHNAHYKRIKDRFTIAIGKKDRKNALLSKAIPLTFQGAPFKPNSFARKIYGNVTFPRGFKMIREESKINALLEKIK